MNVIDKQRSSRSVLPPKEKKSSQQALKQHLQHVVGYDWLVAIIIAPIAFTVAFTLGVVLPEIAQQPWRPPPIGVLCVAGYIFFEVTAFCLERNWSRVSVWLFWCIATPFVALNAFLCLRITQHDALGCLLFVSLCLGCREFLFQYQALCQDAGKSVLSDDSVETRLTLAFLGGSTYGFGVALLCGLAGLLTHAVIGDGRLIHSAIMLEVLCTLALPLGRNILRILLNQILFASTSASLTIPSELPKLDALVMYADVLFWLTMFLEVTFAFVFLLVPDTMAFCIALAVNLVLDAFFPRTLDDIQRRSHATDLPAQTDLTRSTTGPVSTTASPRVEDLSYCIERPESIFLVLTNGVPLSNKSETSALRPGGSSTSESDYSKYPECCQQLLLQWKQAWQWLGNGAQPQVVDPISPRISCLLHNETELVVGCRSGRKEIYAFLQQERMIALNTHFLGSTVGLFLAVIALPIAKYASDNNHTEFLGLQHFSVAELALRAVSVLALRVLADLVALNILEKSATGSEGFGAMPLAFWECRHELSTINGCFFRLLAATCPLFAIIAATL